MTPPVVSCRVQEWSSGGGGRFLASSGIHRSPLGFVDVNRLVRLRQVARSMTTLRITKAIERREAGFETGVWRLS